MKPRADRRLKVAIVSQPEWGVEPGTRQGSLAIWSCEMGKELARHCDVTVFASHQANQPREASWEGVRFVRVPTVMDERLIRRVEKNDHGRAAFTRGSYYGLYALRVAAALRRGKFDIAHITNLSQFVKPIRMISPRTGIILHMQCDWLATLDYQTVAGRVEAADAITGCSQFTANQARERFGAKGRRYAVVHNGVDVERFAPPQAQTQSTGADRPARLLFVARVSPEKGLHVLLEAMALLRPRHPKLELDIIGPRNSCLRSYIVDRSSIPRIQNLARFYENGTYMDHLNAMIQKLGLKEQVRFHGMLAHHELVAFHHGADVMVAPSVWEPFGMMVAEGLSSGRAVVASKVDGICDIIEHGTSGLLVEPDSPPALAQAIDAVLSDRAYASRLGQAGRERALEHFTWQNVAQQLLTVCRQVAGDS